MRTPDPGIDAPSETRQSVSKPVDWQDFRDHLATADKTGKRLWLYPKKPSGRFYRWRTYVSWLLLGVLFAGPFIRINGNPLLLVNFVERRFSILGQIFWPQDTAVFVIAILVFFTSIVVFTTALGRLWCGWACPQTLLMEMVFRKIEYWIEGDAPAQKRLNTAPWTRGKVAKKVLKHGIFLTLSFVIGNTLLSYLIGVEQLYTLVSDDPRNHLTGLSFMLAFTALFYAIFARFREQACTFICPYGRLQSAMLDENSLVVAYDYRRGEQRSSRLAPTLVGRFSRKESTEDRRNAGLGDCIDCRKCVAVCPTGIDIRNGTQMECIHCTACIDACDAVMDKIARPRGLIRYASLNSIERGEHFRWTPRLFGYTALLTALVAVLAWLVFTRADTETTLLRAPGTMFQTTPDGKLQNLYLLKVINKTGKAFPLALRLENVPGELKVMGGELVLPSGGLAQSSVLVNLDRAVIQGHNTKIVVGVYRGSTRLETVQTMFVGPR